MTPSSDVKKFISGIRDIFDLRFERFNKKINLSKDTIVQAIQDSQTKYKVILVHTGKEQLSTHATRDIKYFLTNMNDISDVVYSQIYAQKHLYDSLTAGLAGDPINIQIHLSHWGRVEHPHLAY